MNYQQPERQDALAVSYVLGAMQGKARLRFQGLLMQQPELRQTVWRWEQHFNPVVERLKPVSPDVKVWQRISWRLGWQVQATPQRSYWKELTVLAAAACFALVLLIPRQQSTLTEQIAVVQNSQAEALWLVQWEQGVLKVQATAAVKALSDADYELWMLPADGAAPISLGLLPQQDQREWALPTTVAGVQIAALAVSLEPKGGSPTGQPTGPVLHTAQLVRL